jgi:hypothetical protein
MFNSPDQPLPDQQEWPFVGLTGHYDAEVLNAAGELERLSAPLPGFMSGLSVAGEHADEVDPPAPGLAAESRPTPAGLRRRRRRTAVPTGGASVER